MFVPTMRLLTFLLALVLAFSVTDAMAQKKKKGGNDDKKAAAEAKKWKEKMKKTDPLAYKRMYEEVNDLRGEAAALQRQAEKLEGEKQSVVQNLTAKEEEIKNLEARLQQIKEEAVRKKEAVGTGKSGGSDDFNKGVVHKVQIGAKRNPKLADHQNRGGFWEEVNGEKRYTLGHFRDLQEAENFKKSLIQLGLKEAYIFSYEDGQPVSAFGKK